MKIGVISDTHNPSVGELPPPEVATAFEGVDAIIHAGDIYIPSCLDWLESIAPVYAVEMWADQHFQNDPRVVNKRRVVEMEGLGVELLGEVAHRIGLDLVAAEALPGAHFDFFVIQHGSGNAPECGPGQYPNLT